MTEKGDNEQKGTFQKIRQNGKKRTEKEKLILFLQNLDNFSKKDQFFSKKEILLQRDNQL